jgi:hypothetical protein
VRKEHRAYQSLDILPSYCDELARLVTNDLTIEEVAESAADSLRRHTALSILSHGKRNIYNHYLSQASGDIVTSDGIRVYETATLDVGMVTALSEALGLLGEMNRYHGQDTMQGIFRSVKVDEDSSVTEQAIEQIYSRDFLPDRGFTQEATLIIMSIVDNASSGR